MKWFTTRATFVGVGIALVAMATWRVHVQPPASAGADPLSYSRPLCAHVAQTNPAKAAALCPTAPPANASAPPNLAPTDPPADVCGPWAIASMPGTTGAAIQARHGQLHDCVRVGNSWVITTLGAAGRPGAVGVYHCTDAACLDGQTDHPLAGWTFVHSPRSGGAIILGLDPRYPDTIFVDDAGAQIDFHVDTATFSVPPAESQERRG